MQGKGGWLPPLYLFFGEKMGKEKAIVLFCLILLSSFVSAGVSIKPREFSVSLVGGDSVEKVFELTAGGFSGDVLVSLGWSASPLPDGNEFVVSFDEDSFRMRNGATKRVRMRIQTRLDVEPGVYDIRVTAMAKGARAGGGHSFTYYEPVSFQAPEVPLPSPTPPVVPVAVSDGNVDLNAVGGNGFEALEALREYYVKRVGVLEGENRDLKRELASVREGFGGERSALTARASFFRKWVDSLLAQYNFVYRAFASVVVVLLVVILWLVSKLLEAIRRIRGLEGEAQGAELKGELVE